MASIFEPFFTTKMMGKGTGLGLATVYGIVKQNNGFIKVYSERDYGSAFRIYLPIEEMELPVSLEPRTAPLAGGRETILVVEDEPAILEVTQTILEQLGYHVLPALTPSEAIRLAEQHVSMLRLLISDVVMPEMNCRDLADRLLAVCPDLKCLYMSGYTANVIAHRNILKDGIDFIQKPFTAERLALRVREILDRR